VIFQKKNIFVWVFWGLGMVMFAQNVQFISPLTRPLRLSGTFGELRPDHFHAGIDIKTNQEEGWPVIAIADGYVSRIAISPTGYGKALYIDHPGGYTSVYAHLQRMNGQIQSYIIKKHYELRSYRMDIALKPGELQVKKGDTIAFSGNSGSSGGPHLHFEIRDSRTQQTLDPLAFGFPVKDWVRPTLNFIKVYPNNDGSLVDNSLAPKIYYLAGWGPRYRLRDKDTLYISGSAWFGISAHDLLVDEPNKNGVKSVQLFIDSIEVFSFGFDRLSFDKSRYINALCDYSEWYFTGRWVMQTRIAPCNELDIYGSVKNRGIYAFEPGKVFSIKFSVKDYYGNESVLRFWVKGLLPVYAPVSKINSPYTQFKCNEPSRFDTTGFSFEAPAGAFYDTVNFRYRRIPSPLAYYTDFHKVHYPITPIHKPCKISIFPERLPSRLKNKALIVRVSEQGKPIAAGGKWEHDRLTTNVQRFGTYSVLADTVSPLIRPLNLLANKPHRGNQPLRIKISDDLSGIASYEATLNGSWILMEYDAKNNLLIYNPDEWIQEGNNELVIKVTDGVGNTSSRMISFKYKP
jgi:murein DD-endopeptidase MepM/ murein hydrolase activator NlpD